MEKTYVIRNRYNNKVIFAFKCKSKWLCVEIAIVFNKSLSWANIHVANLSWADLRGADLHGADLDFSCLSLFCKSLKMKTDERIRKQIAYHFASLLKNADSITDEETVILESIKDYANGFHRVNECGYI